MFEGDSAPLESSEEREITAVQVSPPSQRKERQPFAFDASLATPGPQSYLVRRKGFTEALAEWTRAIEADGLSDIPLASLHTLTIDPRDGALCRGAGGMAYTDRAHSQLVALMRAGMPAGEANLQRAHATDTRSLMWRDVVKASKRPRSDGAVLRTFQTWVGRVAVRAARAVVSEIHGLHDTDDLAVAKVIDALPERPTSARVSRQWNHTYASFQLESGDADVRFAFAMSNSETGAGSLTFEGAISIAALDVEVILPSGEKYARQVQIASEAGRTRRRHTLPRFDAQSGSRLTPVQRTAIARQRIAEDVESALDGARVLAKRWALAKADVHPRAVALAQLAVGEAAGAAVLADAFLEIGGVLGRIAEEFMKARVANDSAGTQTLRELATVIADDQRLKSLPHGSAAHMGAALALLAVSKARSWEEARALQAQAGAFIMDGWPR